MTIVHKKEGNFMITSDKNANTIEERYLGVLSTIVTEVEGLVDQFFEDEIHPTIEKMKEVDFNNAFKDALIENFNKSLSPISPSNLVEKNNSQTTNFISIVIPSTLSKFDGGWGTDFYSNFTYNLSTKKLVIPEKKYDITSFARGNYYSSDLLFFDTEIHNKHSNSLVDSDCSHLIQLLYSGFISEKDMKSIFTEQIQTIVKNSILKLSNEEINEISLPIKLVNEDGLNELQIQVEDILEKKKKIKGDDLLVEMIANGDVIKKLVNIYHYSIKEITTVFNYYDFLLAMDAFAKNEMEKHSLVEEFLTTKPFTDTKELVELFDSKVINFGCNFKNNLQILFSDEDTFNRFLVEMYLSENGFVTEESLQMKNNYNLSFVSEGIKNLTYQELFNSFISDKIRIRHKKIELFLFGDVANLLNKSQLKFDFTIDGTPNRFTLASKIPDFSQKTYKKLFEMFPITFDLSIDQKSKAPYIKDWYKFEDILFFIESKIPDAQKNLSVKLTPYSDDERVILSAPLCEIESHLKTKLKKLFEVNHPNFNLVEVKLDCEPE